MKSKFWSLTIIVGIYIVAFAAAAGAVVLLSPYISNVILLLFLGDVAATIVVFIFGAIFRNASVYDPYWSVVPPVLIVGYYMMSGAAFDPAHLFIIFPVCFWAVRLTYNWARGFANLKWQDWRYTGFKQKFPRIYPLICFSGIMLMPTFLVFFGMIPFYVLITGSPNIWLCIVGGAVIMLAALYQTIADAQLRIFRKNPDNKGQVIDTGLWRYSRHPNYFGEILIWWGVLLASLPNLSWLSPIGAVLITCLFFFISVRLIEKHLQKGRPAYADYKKIVRSSIIPFKRRKAE